MEYPHLLYIYIYIVRLLYPSTAPKTSTTLYETSTSN